MQGYNTTLRKPDKFINMIPHRECVMCFVYKPLKDFYNRSSKIVYGYEYGSDSTYKVKKRSYCKDCDKNVRLTNKRKK